MSKKHKLKLKKHIKGKKKASLMKSGVAVVMLAVVAIAAITVYLERLVTVFLLDTNGNDGDFFNFGS